MNSGDDVSRTEQWQGIWFGRMDDKLYTRLITITPDLAQEWLEKNTGNYRSLKPSKVEEYARAMLAGKWEITGEAIKFDVTGKLCDGQHRLYAVIKSGATIQSLVVMGVPVDAALVLDSGALRTKGDYFQSLGIPNSRQVAAACRFLWQWEQGYRLDHGHAHNPIAFQVLETYQAHPNILASIIPGRRVSKAIGCNPTVSVLMHYLFMRIHETDATEFFNRLADGALLLPGDPITVLRNRFIAMKGQRHTVVPNMDQAAWFVKCWNAYRTHSNMKIVRWSVGADESIPVPV